MTDVANRMSAVRKLLSLTSCISDCVATPHTGSGGRCRGAGCHVGDALGLTSVPRGGRLTLVGARISGEGKELADGLDLMGAGVMYA